MSIILLCIIVPAGLWIFGIDLKQDSVPNILSLLVAVAGAIFTIMSIWVAFLYPNVLKTLRGENLLNVDFSGGGEDNVRLKEIISVIVQSALTMIVALSLLIFSAFLDDFSFRYKPYAEGLIQFLLIGFSCLQISALISTIAINMSFISVLDKQAKKRARDHDA